MHQMHKRDYRFVQSMYGATGLMPGEPTVQMKAIEVMPIIADRQKCCVAVPELGLGLRSGGTLVLLGLAGHGVETVGVKILIAEARELHISDLADKDVADFREGISHVWELSAKIELMRYGCSGPRTERFTLVHFDPSRTERVMLER